MDAPAPADIDGVEPTLREVRAALAAAPDDTRRRAALARVEALVPAAGPLRVYLLSFLAGAGGDAAALRALHTTLQGGEHSLQMRHFFYWQRITRHAGLDGGPALAPAALYTGLLDECRRRLGFRGDWIAPAARDQDRVVVITNQLLGPQHAPTADCLDYCVLLQERLQRRVFLVNTADMPWQQPMPYADALRFNRVESYSTLGRVGYKGVSIDFYQCRQPMPNLDEVQAILATVSRLRPAFVFSLGHSNVAADLCAEFVTVATMPFGTNLPRARSTLYVLPRRRRPDDAAHMTEWGIRDAQIIEAEYTFRLPPPTAPLTRAALGIPADAYAIAIVGNRLDDEVTPGVAADLARLVRAAPGVHLVFMGTFPRFAEVQRSHGELMAHAAFLGYRQDVPAVYDLCDAYYNPPRYGGGSSAAFALGRGLPVLTDGGGDVGNIAGERFHLRAFDDVIAFVRRARADADFAREWRDLARQRFAAIADREGMLRHIADEAARLADVRLTPLA